MAIAVLSPSMVQLFMRSRRCLVPAPNGPTSTRGFCEQGPQLSSRAKLLHALPSLSLHLHHTQGPGELLHTDVSTGSVASLLLVRRRHCL